MNRTRALAALAHVLPALLFFAWALVAGAMTRGPAGVAAFCVLAGVAGAFAWRAWRVGTGRAAAWGAGTKLVVALDALFAAYVLVAIPALRSSFQAADEAAARANLARLREAIGDAPPARLSMLVPARLAMIPRLNLPKTGHPLSREVIFGPPSASADRGTWLYDNDEASPTFGTVIADCTHTDAKGSSWSGY